MSFARRVKREVSFSNKERKQLLITSFVAALIMFMFVWRTTDYDVLSGILSFLILLIMSGISMFLFVLGPKIVGVLRGYHTTYSYWINGLLTGFVVSFISYGLLPIITPGHIEIKTIDRLRHGKRYFGENKKDMFLVLASAPLTALFVSFLFFYALLITNASILYYGVIVNAILAFFCLLPFTKNVGATIFFARRGAFFALLGLSALYFVVIISKTLVPLLIMMVGALAYWLLIAIKKKK